MKQILAKTIVEGETICVRIITIDEEFVCGIVDNIPSNKKIRFGSKITFSRNKLIEIVLL